MISCRDDLMVAPCCHTFHQGAAVVARKTPKKKTLCHSLAYSLAFHANDLAIKSIKIVRIKNS